LINRVLLPPFAVAATGYVGRAVMLTREEAAVTVIDDFVAEAVRLQGILGMLTTAPDEVTTWTFRPPGRTALSACAWSGSTRNGLPHAATSATPSLGHYRNTNEKPDVGVTRS
jgi:hypothetical protein